MEITSGDLIDKNDKLYSYKQYVIDLSPRKKLIITVIIIDTEKDEYEFELAVLDQQEELFR